MSSLTIDFLPKKCLFFLKDLADNKTPDWIKDILEWAEKTSYENGPDVEEVVKQKEVARITPHNVEQLRGLLKGTSVNEINTDVKKSNYCRLKSVLKDGNIITFHFTVTEDPRTENWRLSSITWAEGDTLYKLEIP